MNFRKQYKQLSEQSQPGGPLSGLNEQSRTLHDVILPPNFRFPDRYHRESRGQGPQVEQIDTRNYRQGPQNENLHRYSVQHEEFDQVTRDDQPRQEWPVQEWKEPNQRNPPIRQQARQWQNEWAGEVLGV